MIEANIFGTMKRCPVCGKEFLVPDVHIWAYQQQKAKGKKATAHYFFCTWGCMRKWEAENKPKRKLAYDSPDLDVYAV